MRRQLISTLVASVAMAGMLGGCAYPTEKAEVLDNRPQISFKDTKSAETLAVFVDGIRNGYVADYLEGKRALRLMPGTHVITVPMLDGTTYSEKVYVSDGVTRTITLPQPKGAR